MSLDLLLSRPALLPSTAAWTEFNGWLEQASSTIIQHMQPGDNTNPGYAFLAQDHVAEVPRVDVTRVEAIRAGARQGGLQPGAPTVQAVITGRDEYLRFRADLESANPGFRIDVADVVSTVNEDGGRALVYLTCRKSHYRLADRKPHESVALLEWRRDRLNTWHCVKSRFLHGYSSCLEETLRESTDESMSPALAYAMLESSDIPPSAAEKSSPNEP